MGFWIMVVLFSAIIIGISMIFKNKKPVMFIIPSGFAIVGMVLLILSFIIGDFSGMGMTMYSIALLISSAAALIVITFFGFLKSA
ncbi:YesK family protein [Terribacillus sp. FSL K6-0262]|uniref:YesK family protein n=1 Tax=Terribacillus sp. FSL K6-0262 TaxID=2921447 RepID=UPI0030EB5BFE